MWRKSRRQEGLPNRMNKLSLLNVSIFLTSPTVIRVLVIALGVLIASLSGPATVQACSLTGGTCGN